MQMPNAFGPALKRLRKENHLSQEELANKLASTQRHISFLETGRSAPTKSMLIRIATSLDLNISQRAALFDASGYRSPYRKRDFNSEEITTALDMMEARILNHWPFPAFVLDQDWNVLRMNKPAQAMFEVFPNESCNMLAVLLSPHFIAKIENWEEVSTAFYFRMQACAENNQVVMEAFENAKDQGLFDHMTNSLMGLDDIPIYIPAIMRLPSGERLKMTSFVGNLLSVHDALVEGFDIELLVPVDAPSEDLMLKKYQR